MPKLPTKIVDQIAKAYDKQRVKSSLQNDKNKYRNEELASLAMLYAGPQKYRALTQPETSVRALGLIDEWQAGERKDELIRAAAVLIREIERLEAKNVNLN